MYTFITIILLKVSLEFYRITQYTKRRYTNFVRIVDIGLYKRSVLLLHNGGSRVTNI